MNVDPGRLVAGGSEIRDVARTLAQVTGRVVIDRANLAGQYDLELTWAPESSPATREGRPVPAVDSNAPSLFTAVQDQLGLKLEPTTAPMEVLVVDAAERPTPD